MEKSCRLSVPDQRLIAALYAERVLHETRLDTDLSSTLIVTDFASQRPKISLDVVTQPAQIITTPSGGCALHDISSDVHHEERRSILLTQIRKAVLEKPIDQIALVASAPSLMPHRSLVDTIDQLRSAEEYVHQRFGKKRLVSNFICVKFPDGRTYPMQVNTPEFHAWYDRYEQEVLGRDDDAFGDNDYPIKVAPSYLHLVPS